MRETGFNSPSYLTLKRSEWKSASIREAIPSKVIDEVGYPCVVKAANQGSSIGITILTIDDPNALTKAIDKAFFVETVHEKDWKSKSADGRTRYIKSLCDIREGTGLPVWLSSSIHTGWVFHPEQLLQSLDAAFDAGDESVRLESMDGDSEVLVEGFIDGKEFSCIVIRKEDGTPVALPPTEIRKGKELFDYRSKYLPGLSRKITPIQLPSEHIDSIRQSCERLFLSLKFNVYARIDGFINNEGNVFLNDPNTTSGMMPSSFFFHQAAEIGLNPSQFLTYIIRTSVQERITDMKDFVRLPEMLSNLDTGIRGLRKAEKSKIRVAVIMGGYSSERHISVESGRNIFEKLASSDKYLPVPIFLTGSGDDHILYQLPVNLMLKDNADDIREKCEHYDRHPVIGEIMNLCNEVTEKYSAGNNVLEPRRISYDTLSREVDAVFIGLHGRPGEDGEVQKKLEAVGLPYNGSGTASSRTTINKYETNEVLLKNGFSVARHQLAEKSDWIKNQDRFLDDICSVFKFPFIAKPVDDGCSSAVKKIKTRAELEAFCALIFRDHDGLDEKWTSVLGLKAKEEFPIKSQILLEDLVTKGDAVHFLEITGGLLTHLLEDGTREYQIFEASEALSEGDVLSLEEKFLAGEGQNITPARYAKNKQERDRISEIVKVQLGKAAKLLDIEGYARIDAFVRIFADGKVEVIFIEVNSLPGMTPATCIFHQTAIAGYKPYDFIDRIL
ncbi:MAG: D-alanine--D-alanine ligase, partial [Bacteroidota bacterium]